MISASNLSVTFGKFKALKEINFEITRSTGVVGLIGPNGAGKTTLISVILGLVRPSSGSYRLIHNDVGYCCDTPEFESFLTAAEVIAHAANLKNLEHFNDNEAETLLSRVGLARASNKRAGGLSRGMKQRLGIACSLVGDPAILILDEPTSALDPFGRQDVIQLIKELSRETLVIVSTHLLEDVQTLADDLIMIDNGRMLYAGELSKVLSGRKQQIDIIFDDEADFMSAKRILTAQNIGENEVKFSKDKLLISCNALGKIKDYLGCIASSEFPPFGSLTMGSRSLYDAFENMHEENKRCSN